MATRQSAARRRALQREPRHVNPMRLRRRRCQCRLAVWKFGTDLPRVGVPTLRGALNQTTALLALLPEGFPRQSKASSDADRRMAAKLPFRRVSTHPIAGKLHPTGGTNTARQLSGPQHRPWPLLKPGAPPRRNVSTQIVDVMQLTARTRFCAGFMNERRQVQLPPIGVRMLCLVKTKVRKTGPP